MAMKPLLGDRAKPIANTVTEPKDVSENTGIPNTVTRKGDSGASIPNTVTTMKKP